VNQTIIWRCITDQPEFDFAKTPKVLALARHFDKIYFVWPSELNEPSVNGETFYKAWAEIPFPTENYDY
jgi:hypothetical protein